MRAKERSVVTWSRHGNSSGEWLQTEHTPVTEPETPKHESSVPVQIRLTSQSENPYQFQMDESWLIRAGAADALENQVTTFPVVC